MNKILYIGFLSTFFNFFISCNGQIKSNSATTSKNEKKGIVGGGCDGCELMYVGMPANISSIDTSAGWFEKGQKLIVTGKVLKLDGRTPAPNVIIYYWQTDNNGYYSPGEGMDKKAERHGHIRGWVKSDEEGNYSIYTIRPAPYPNGNDPAHIHVSIKEPEIQNEYYIDEFVFDDDKLLLNAINSKKPDDQRGNGRGGSGVLRVLLKDDLQIAEHNIVLGLNIPNYPETKKDELLSGLNIGEGQPSFIPYHAFGPDKGSRACPVCKYGRYHGIIYFVGDNPDWDEIKKWLTYLDNESVKRDKYLKAYFVYGNSNNYKKQIRQSELETIGTELKLQKLALTFVPSFKDKESEANLNKINSSVENTFIIYRHRAIIDKYVNLKPTEQNFKLITELLDKTKGNYFDLNEPEHE